MEKVWYVAVILFVVQLAANLVISHYIKKALEKRDKKYERKEEARLEYENIQFGLITASAKLSYALAMAIKRGSPNGEVEGGIEAYNNAIERQSKFLQQQTLYSIK